MLFWFALIHYKWCAHNLKYQTYSCHIQPTNIHYCLEIYTWGIEVSYNRAFYKAAYIHTGEIACLNVFNIIKNGSMYNETSQKPNSNGGAWSLRDSVISSPTENESFYNWKHTEGQWAPLKPKVGFLHRFTALDPKERRINGENAFANHTALYEPGLRITIEKISHWN